MRFHKLFFILVVASSMTCCRQDNERPQADVREIHQGAITKHYALNSQQSKLIDELMRVSETSSILTLLKTEGIGDSRWEEFKTK